MLCINICVCRQKNYIRQICGCLESFLTISRTIQPYHEILLILGKPYPFWGKKQKIQIYLYWEKKLQKANSRLVEKFSQYE